jgi:hypothetical protein
MGPASPRERECERRIAAFVTAPWRQNGEETLPMAQDATALQGACVPLYVAR